VNDWSLSLSPIFPDWAFLALGAAAVLAVAFTGWTRPRAALLRALVAGLLLFFIADPALKRGGR